MVAMTDLTPAARLYLLGLTRNDVRAAEAIAEVVFCKAGLSLVAREYGLSKVTLHGQVARARAGIKELMEQGMITAGDLALSDV